MDNVIHFEIPADELERAQKFYKSIFGWNMNAVPGMDYILVSTTESNEKGMPIEPGAINGGMLKRQAPVTSPLITINVRNIDDTLKKLKKMGGEVVKGKIQVGDMGYSAYFKDTEGNTIGLWQLM